MTENRSNEHDMTILHQVWNANNGHLMNKLAALEEAEVTGITSFHAKSKILTVGWHRKIITYHDDKEVSKGCHDYGLFSR